MVACGELPPGAEDWDIVATGGDAGSAALANLASECGEGLHLVKQRTQLVEDDGTTSCAFTAMPVMVCIQGICGDGRCEAPEAAPCGCTLDCAISD